MLTFINIKKKYNVQWGALNKPIQEANYKSKNKIKKYTIKRQIFLNSTPIMIVYERVTPFDG